MLLTKMAVVLLLALVTVAELASGRQLHVQNRLGYRVWVGILGNPGKGTPEGGGFVLNNGQRRTVNVADDWAGRFWARTGCNFNGNGQGRCATGDCGNKLSCSGAGGVPPVTLAEVTLRGAGGLDFYDISLVDGFNVPVQRTVDIADGWAGRFWARTGCNFDGNGQGHCATGDCGNKLSCNGAGGVPPATLAEITLNGAGGQDFYDVSLVDGFNVPVQMRPTRGGGNGYSCTTAGCNSNLNPGCPDDLKVWEGGNVVACKSSCVAHNSDEYCCRGAFNSPNVCRRPPSGDYFKNNCPGAYSYAYDDQASTFTCQNTDYDIIFG